MTQPGSVEREWVQDAQGDLLVPGGNGAPGAARLRPIRVDAGLMRFELVWPDDAVPNRGDYAHYHGRFIELLLAHFGDDLHFIAAYPMD